LRTQPSAAKSGRPFIPRAAARLAPAIVGLACLGAAALPAQAAEPWGFEQVTPVDKTGAEPVVNKTAFANYDGSGVVYSTMAAMGSFDPMSAPYTPSFLATRGPGDWNGVALDVGIDPETPSTAIWSTVGAVSPDGTRAVVFSRRVLAPGGEQGALNVYRRDLVTGEYRFMAGNPHPFAYEDVVQMGSASTSIVVGGTDDFDRIVLQSGRPLTSDSGEGADDRAYLYQWDEDSGLSLESRFGGEDGTPMYSAPGLGVGVNNARNPNYLSADGRQLVVVSQRQVMGYDPVQMQEGWIDNPEAGLYVRRDGVTIPISYSRLPGDDTTTRPVFDDSVIASPDGRFIVFRTSHTHRLSPDAPADNGRGYYLYDRAQPEEDQLRFIAAGSALGARSIMLADDGQTFYFATEDILAPGATTFSLNLYAWHDGEVRLIAKGRGWNPGGMTASDITHSGYMASPNGRYFAFTTVASVTGEDTTYPGGCEPPPDSAEPAGGWCREAYLYDAETDTTVCASCAADGHRSRGHAGTGPAEMFTTMIQARPLVTDAGEVYFDTPNQLVAGDGNGDRDVYAYRDGDRRLVSRATPGTSAKFLTMSGDGKSVFVVTNDKLVGQDRDHLDDVYVTRAGAGLAGQNPPAPRPACEGGGCREGSTDPGAGAAAGTLTFSGAGNVKAPRPGVVAVSRLKATRGMATTLMVRVSSAGRISVSGPSVRRARVSVAKGGRYRLKVALTAKARRKLAQRKRLSLNVRVAFRAADGRPVTRRLTLTFRAPASRKGGL
jgi:hypothetical protein